MKSKVRKTTKIQRRRRKEGEIATQRTAIRNHCLECLGYNSAEVKRCTVSRCWLYPYRLGSQGVDPEC